MSHRKVSVLALALAGAVSFTTVGVPATFAVDAGTTTSVSVVSPAGQPNPSGDFEIDKNGVLTAYTGSSAEVTIPDGVTEISTEAFENAQLTKLWIPASVRVIGDDAFVSQDLKEITFQDDKAHPSQLVTIGDRAFQSTSLATMALPGSVVTIGDNAFAGMSRLTSVRLGAKVAAGQLVAAFPGANALISIEIDANNGNYASVDGVLYTKDHSHLIAYPQAKNKGGSYAVLDGTTDIDEYAFADASVTSVTLPSSLRRIGDYAFESSRLTSLTLPDSFETIGSWAFSYASNLARVDLGGTTTVSDDAFLNDLALTEVNLRPDLGRLKEIGEDAFGGCTNLTSLVVPASVTSVEGVSNTGVDTLELGDRVSKLSIVTRGIRNVRHIVVRGGVNGEFYSEGQASNGRPESAFFGEGMTTFSFWGETPRVVVLPASLTSLELDEDAASDVKANTAIYVAGKGGIAGLEDGEGCDGEGRIRDGEPEGVLRAHARSVGSWHRRGRGWVCAERGPWDVNDGDRHRYRRHPECARGALRSGWTGERRNRPAGLECSHVRCGLIRVDADQRGCEPARRRARCLVRASLDDVECRILPGSSAPAPGR